MTITRNINGIISDISITTKTLTITTCSTVIYTCGRFNIQNIASYCNLSAFAVIKRSPSPVCIVSNSPNSSSIILNKFISHWPVYRSTNHSTINSINLRMFSYIDMIIFYNSTSIYITTTSLNKFLIWTIKSNCIIRYSYTFTSTISSINIKISCFSCIAYCIITSISKLTISTINI